MKPTIYLGLGGTGARTLSCIKQLFTDNYGLEKIPKDVAFLAIDTTDLSYDLPDHMKQDFLWLNTYYSCIQEYYQVQKQKGYCKWMPEENIHWLPNRNMSSPVAPIRTMGRLYADYSMRQIMLEFDKRLNIIDFSNSSNQVDLLVVLSLVGGFGSGSFLPIIASLKEKYKERINVHVYAIMHNAFVENTSPSSHFLLLNDVTSILELDHLFSTNEISPIELEVAGKIIKIDSTLLRNVVLFDNKMEGGYVAQNITELYDILAITLYSQYSVTTLPIFDSLQLRKNAGDWDVKNKKAWAQSLSSCSVVYRGHVLAEQYHIQAAIKMIENMKREDAHIREDVLKWIDRNNFRETYDHIINAICSPEYIANIELPKLNPTKSDGENISICRAYAYPHERLITTDTTRQLLSNYRNSLRNVVDNSFIANGEIGNAIIFLHELQNYCEIFKNKLEGDLEHLKRVINIKDQLNWLTKGYASYLEQKAEWYVLTRRRKNQELLDTLVGVPAQERIKLIYEVERHQLAYSLISEFAMTIVFYLKDLEQYAERLTNVQRRLLLEKEALNMQRYSHCEIDLSLNELQNMEIDNDDTIVNAFILIGLSGHQSIFNMSEDEIRHSLLNRTANSPRVQKYKTTSISDVINRLSDIESANLQAAIQSKLKSCLKIDHRGLLTNASQCRSKSSDSFIIYTGPTNLYLKLTNNFDKQVIQCETQNSCNHLIFTKFNNWTIPYCIESINDHILNKFQELIQQVKSKQISYNPFIDQLWFERIQDEKFSLIPKHFD